MWNLYRKIHHEARLKRFYFVIIADVFFRLERKPISNLIVCFDVLRHDFTFLTFILKINFFTLKFAH